MERRRAEQMLLQPVRQDVCSFWNQDFSLQPVITVSSKV